MRAGPARRGTATVNASPTQRRIPPPNGSYRAPSGVPSVNRPGMRASGSGNASGSRCSSGLGHAITVPADRTCPAISIRLCQLTERRRCRRAQAQHLGDDRPPRARIGEEPLGDTRPAGVRPIWVGGQQLPSAVRNSSDHRRRRLLAALLVALAASAVPGPPTCDRSCALLLCDWPLRAADGLRH
jgi:hypothetical protein